MKDKLVTALAFVLAIYIWITLLPLVVALNWLQGRATKQNSQHGCYTPCKDSGRSAQALKEIDERASIKAAILEYGRIDIHKDIEMCQKDIERWEEMISREIQEVPVLNVELRNSCYADLELIMEWRNNPLIYASFYIQRKPLTWEEHKAWWLSRTSFKQFIIVYEQEDVGVINISQLDHWCPEIGFLVGEVSLWGKGIGKEAVKVAYEWLQKKGYEYTLATVNDDNERSLKLLKFLGFKELGQVRPHEIWLVKCLLGGWQSFVYVRR